MAAKDIREVFEEKARAGDGAFAIALAIMDLSDSQEATAKSLQRLGNGDASTSLGALEAHSMQIVAAAEALGSHIETAAGNIASALDGLSDH